MNATTRRCPRCETVKPRGDFARTASRADGLAVWCRRCNADAQRERVRRDPVAHARRRQTSDRKSRYGVSSAEFDRMLHEQGGVCAVCRRPSTKTLHVDHCHDTGVVRGLLCDLCNRGLGYFRDESQMLRAAADYLEVAR